MPKNQVSDLITDQEIAFALLILSGAMTDRKAAEAVRLNPETAAYTKAKPRVVAFMHEHRPALRGISVTEASMGIAATSDSSRPLPMQSSCLCDRMYKRSGSGISLSLLAG
jgi:hypothetical protein